MGGKLNVYDMALKGVNVTEDPIHLTDGELTKAQNLQIDPVLKRGAVRRRDGLARLNGAALAGAVTGLAPLPLPDLSTLTRYFYEAWDDALTGPTANTFRTSPDGAVWTTGVLAVRPQRAAQLPAAINPAEMAVKWSVLRNKLYYPGNDYTETGASATPMTIHVWDGTADFVLCLIPIHPSFNFGADTQGVLAITPYSSELLILTTVDGNGATARGRVMILDITSGQITQLGVETALTGAPLGLLVYNGRIFIGTFIGNLTAGKVFSLRLGDATLTDSGLVLALGEGVTDMIVFLGDLYVGTSAGWPAANAIPSHIKKFTTSTGAWSTAATNGSTALGNRYGPFILSSDGLTAFCFFCTRGGQQDILKSTDGAAWTSDYDITVNVGATFIQSGRPVRDANGDIYWVIYNSSQAGKIIKRTAAGVWSIADSAANIQVRGPLNTLRY